jgi:ubiquinone/menaquinone biosynthesis C-methylase UbiE
MEDAMRESDRAFTGSIPELYDRYLGPMLFEPYALNVGRRFRRFQGALLETAAGTGRVTRALAEAADPRATIIATDLNEPMLARAAEMIRASNIEWRQADAQSLAFDTDSFDAVVCQFGVMFFPDKAAGFAEARRVLKPGGRFVFSVWDSLHLNDMSRIAHETVASLFPHDPPSFLARVPFGYHDEGHIRDALADAGFGEIAIERVALATPAGSALDAATGLCRGSPLSGEIEARYPEGLETIVEAVARALALEFGEGAIIGHGQALVITAA